MTKNRRMKFPIFSEILFNSIQYSIKKIQQLKGPFKLAIAGCHFAIEIAKTGTIRDKW